MKPCIVSITQRRIEYNLQVNKNANYDIARDSTKFREIARLLKLYKRLLSINRKSAINLKMLFCEWWFLIKANDTKSRNPDENCNKQILRFIELSWEVGWIKFQIVMLRDGYLIFNLTGRRLGKYLNSWPNRICKEYKCVKHTIATDVRWKEDLVTNIVAFSKVCLQKI